MQGCLTVSLVPDVKYSVASWIQIYCLIVIFNFFRAYLGSITEQFSSSVLTTPRECHMNPLAGGDFSSVQRKVKQSVYRVLCKLFA